MSIVVDTNVVSEMMRDAPHSGVRGWLDEQIETDLLLSVVSEAELRYGIERLPKGRKRDDLVAELSEVLRDDFSGRILPFDSAAARAYAIIKAERRVSGGSYTTEDCMIAATAKSIGAAVATRNVRDFEDCGVEVINPWDFTP